MMRVDARIAVAALGIALSACEGETLVGGDGGRASTAATTSHAGNATGAGGGISAGGSPASYGGAGPNTAGTGGTAKPPGAAGAGGLDPGAGGAGGGAISLGNPCVDLPDAQTDPATGHCYVDRTPVGGATHAEATAICEALAPGMAHLLTMGSDGEQGFVTARFLASSKETADAWLGLACSESAHPDFIDCYCPGGCEGAFERDLALQSWAWVDGAVTPFLAWTGVSPDGAGRAAALVWSGTWGWLDRDETATSADGREHRVLCEIE